jgi:hypothetical protein
MKTSEEGGTCFQDQPQHEFVSDVIESFCKLSALRRLSVPAMAVSVAVLLAACQTTPLTTPAPSQPSPKPVAQPGRPCAPPPSPSCRAGTMMTCAPPGRPCSRLARSDPQAGVARCLWCAQQVNANDRASAPVFRDLFHAEPAVQPRRDRYRPGDGLLRAAAARFAPRVPGRTRRRCTRRRTTC